MTPEYLEHERKILRFVLPICIQSFLIDMPCTIRVLAMNVQTGYRRTMTIAEQQWGGVFQ